MSKEVKKSKVAIISILLIWVTINTLLIFGIRIDNKILYIVLNVLSSVITTCFIAPSLKGLLNKIKLILKINTESINTDNKDSKSFFFILITLIIIGFALLGIRELPEEYTSIFKNGDAPITENEYTSDQKEITTTIEKPTIPYDFSQPTQNFDIYFYPTEARSILDSLDASFANIIYIKPISDDELEIADGYGDVSVNVVEHEKHLLTLLDNTFLKQGPLPKVAIDYIITKRLDMEKVYQTPANRKLIANAYLKKVTYALSDNVVKDAENAVRFTLGRIHSEISWDCFSAESINDLITMYEHLKKVNTGKGKRIDEIINALERLKIRADEHPFHPIQLS